MKLYLALAALLFPVLLEAQPNEASALNNDETAHRRKSRLHDLQFDRIDYVYKDNLLQYTVQHNAGGGYPRTWRYFYQQEGADALINQLRTKYPNKQLHGATRVAFRNSVYYEVIMQDKRRWYIYQADSATGGISLKKKFRKH